MKFKFNFVKPGVFNLPETNWWGFDPEDHIEIQPHWKWDCSLRLVKHKKWVEW